MSTLKTSRLLNLEGTSAPTVPTPDSLDRSETIANTEFVQEAVQNLTFIDGYFTDAPVLSGPSAANKNAVVLLTRTNHDTEATYFTTVTGGSFIDHGDGTISWTLPDVTVDTMYYLNEYATKKGELHSTTTSFGINVLFVPTIAPTLSGNSSGNETTNLIVTITNYDNSALSYNINVSGGSFVRVADTITWTLPAVESDTNYTISASVTTVDGTSSTTIKTVLVINIPLVADTAIQVTDYLAIQDTNDGFSHV